MRAIGAPMPEVDVYVPAIDAPWPPPGGGLIQVDARQRVFTGLLRGLGRVAPAWSPGFSMMMLYFAFDAEAARGVDAVFEFRLSGRGGGVFSVTVRDDDCRIEMGSITDAPDVVYDMEASTWLAMAQGHATGDEAVLLGKLRIRGDVELGRKFNELFQPQGNEPIRAASRSREEELTATRPSLVDRVLRRGRAA
jgi:putative sterol carrier protein